MQNIQKRLAIFLYFDIIQQDCSTLMEYFYLNHAQQQLGPCSLEELKLKAQAGEIPFNTLVANDGAAQWVELSSLIHPQGIPPITPQVTISRPSENIPNYLAASILTTLFCCLPFGIVAIISSCKVDKWIALGDFEGAKAASKSAKKWIIWSIILGVLVFASYFFICVLTGVSSTTK